MKTLFYLCIAVCCLLSCKNNENQKESDQVDHSKMNHDAMSQSDHQHMDHSDHKMNHPKLPYPKPVKHIFNTHGGIKTWDAMNNLCFQIDGKNGTETHTTDLKSRKAKIQAEQFALGYDGNEYWLSQEDSVFDSGRVKFYHNLMFYFYAMPFVLGDNGISYTDVPDIEIQGKTYKGIKTFFAMGVGLSEKDNYIMYLDKETNRLEWLAYTVTYGEDKLSNDYSYIKYDKWQDINGLRLPKTLIWYSTKDGKPFEVRKELTFKNVTISETVLNERIFIAPKNAETIN